MRGQAVTKLMELAPPTATLVTQGADGREEQEVPSALIQRNDLLKVGAPLPRLVLACFLLGREAAALSRQRRGEARDLPR